MSSSSIASALTGGSSSNNASSPARLPQVQTITQNVLQKTSGGLQYIASAPSGQTRRTKLNNAILATYVNNAVLLSTLTAGLNDSGYILQNIDKEVKRVSKLNDGAKKDIHHIRQLTLAQTYSAKYHRFLINIVIFAFFILMLCLCVTGAYRSGAIRSFWVVAIIILISTAVFGAGMLYVFSTMRMRTKTDWDQYNFRPSKDVLDAR